MAYTGWVKLWRQIFDHKLYENDAFSRREAWIDLIAQAAFEGPKIGTLTASLRYLASRWRWSQKAVRHYLYILEKEGMIQRSIGAQRRAGLGAEITVCKYTEYQSVGRSQGHRLGRKEKKKKKTRINTSLKREVVIASDDTPALTAFSVSMAFKAWNATAERLDLPVARTLTTARQRAIGARLREHGGADAWHKALANVEASAFLQGKGGGRDGWRASLDFLVQASSFSKVIDGVYGNGATVQDTNSLDHYRRILGTDGEGGH